MSSQIAHELLTDTSQIAHALLKDTSSRRNFRRDLIARQHMPDRTSFSTHSLRHRPPGMQDSLPGMQDSSPGMQDSLPEQKTLHQGVLTKAPCHQLERDRCPPPMEGHQRITPHSDICYWVSAQLSILSTTIASFSVPKSCSALMTRSLIGYSRILPVVNSRWSSIINRQALHWCATGIGSLTFPIHNASI